MREEYFDVVDENDNVIERRLGSECLRLGLLHRPIVVFLVNSLNEVYLQKRSGRVSSYPGHWSASCTGHVSSGETYLEAAKREVQEELAIDCEPIEVIKFISPKWKYGKIAEWEYTAVFKVKISEVAIVLSEETEEGKFVPFEEFEKLTEATPQIFTPDTKLALQHYVESRDQHRIPQSS